ncbi:MAG TPA: lanthionine synthetase LanC family protein [Thermoanaerobaculia bacterium]|nr:lanthionine synthetase LanC family protein [Thermoanaerobaculia bacterium]
MAITDRLILPPDVLLVPVAELPEQTRRRFECGEGDFALTRPRLRTPSRIVDADSAALLAHFRQPCTVVEAVIRFSRERATDPEAALEEAYPMLERLLASGFLVEEGDLAADGIRPTLLPGSDVDGWEVIAAVQALEDTELYQVRRFGPRRDAFGALKIERQAGGRAAPALAREATILRQLGGVVAPRLLSAGALDGRRWLLLEWCPGAEAQAAAAELRDGGPEGRRELLALARALAGAYAHLHGRRVVHGDVHPRNALVGAARRPGASLPVIRLIDFGISRRVGGRGGLARVGRAGIGFFYEPEYARAELAGRPRPPASYRGEQYALGALLYLLLSGAHYRDFRLDRESLLRQIAAEPPLPFAERGVEPWPEVERILGRALAKRPAARFGSVAELAAALGALAPLAPAAAIARRGGSSRKLSPPLLAAVLRRLRRDGPLFARGLAAPPRASLNFGAAGVAYALYRIGLAREDPDLLCDADAWAARAAAEPGEEAFYEREGQLRPEIVGRISPYHTASGPPCVQALIAHARGDPAAQAAATEAFLAAVAAPGEEVLASSDRDLTLGRSGVLLACVLLLDVAPRGSSGERLRAPLLELGGQLLHGLWSELDRRPPLASSDDNLGIAHGWAGYLYATLRWCETTAPPLPPRLAARLGELARCALPWRRGLRWPWRGAAGPHRGETAAMPGWCNGSAGLIHLWTLAHRRLGKRRYAALAVGAGWNAWEEPAGSGDLCCGLSGRAYGLLNLHRHLAPDDPEGGGPWLNRARTLAASAARAVSRISSDLPNGRDSLYRGELGAAVLAAELEHPEEARMPFFESEGW